MSDLKPKHILMIPWNALLLLSMITLRLLKIDLVLGSAASIGLIIGCVLIMALEFIRSGDVVLKKFIIDTSFSNLTLIGATWYISYMLFTGVHIHFIETMIYAVIVMDAWISPINGFRTALRNFQVGNN